MTDLRNAGIWTDITICATMEPRFTIIRVEGIRNQKT